MKVLITDGMSKKALTVVRSIKDIAGQVGVVSRYPVSVAGVSRYVARSHQVSRNTPQKFISNLNSILYEFEYDYLLPVGGWSAQVVSNFRSELDVEVDFALPDDETMSIAQDKLKTYKLATKLDVPTPETVLLDDISLKKAADDIGFPAVLKASSESEPRYVTVVNSDEELEAEYSRYRQERSSIPLLQSYLSGEGCGFFALYFDGECVGSYSHRRIREYPPSGGASACAESIVDEELKDYGQRLLDRLEWNGVAMVEFKRDVEGKPNLVEINPKFWGSLELAERSGLSFAPALISYKETGGRYEFSFSPCRVHWPLSGNLQYAVHRPRSAPSVLRDCISPTTQSNIQLTDPVPHAVELAKALGSEIFTR
jgi:predicted ATP-grasp superfamily ATP-dependent carboligase